MSIVNDTADMVYSFINLSWDDITLAHKILIKGKLWDSTDKIDTWYYGEHFYQIEWDDTDSIIRVKRA